MYFEIWLSSGNQEVMEKLLESQMYDIKAKLEKER